MKFKSTYLALAVLAGFGLALGACSSGSDDAPVAMPDPEPTPHACDAGPSQECVDARSAELAALGDDATVADYNAARAALAGAQAALNAVNAAVARQALVDAAAMCTDGTQACVDAHQALVDALTADSTTSVRDLTAAQAALSSVQMAKADADAAAAAAATRQALVDAAAACTDGTQACVDAHQALVDALTADSTTSPADLAAAQAALGSVQMAKAEADAAAEAARLAAEAAAARQALVDAAAACTDATQACVDAHQALVDALSADDTTLAIDLVAAESDLAEVQSAKAEADAAEAARLAAEAAAAARAALANAATCSDGTAECVAAHQTLVDALEADASTTADDLAIAQAALSAVQELKVAADEAARLASEAEAARQALIDEATCTDGTAACVAAHEALVEALEADTSTSPADLDAAKAALSSVQMAKAEADAEAARLAAEAAAAAARQALVDAAMCTDGTQACVDAHQALVEALEADDTTLASELDAARAALGVVQTAKSEADAEAERQRLAAEAAAARLALETAAMCTDATPACVAAHDAWIEVLQAELAALNADDDATLAQVRVAELALAGAMTARGTVQTAIDTANQMATDTETVNNAITAASDAIGDLTDASSGDEVQAARDLITAAQTALNEATSLSGSEAATTLQTSIDGLGTSIEPQETRIANAAEAARVAAATKAAGTKEKAIAAEAAQTADASLGGTARTDADGTTTSDDATDDVYGLDISRKRGEAATIKVTDPAMAGEDDPKFEVAEMLSGGRQMLTRTMEANDDGEVVTEVVLVATDIEGPTATLFAMVAGQALDVLSTTGLATTDAAVNPNNALDIAEDTTLTGDPNANLMFARSTMDGELNYTRDNPVEGEPPTVGVDEGLHDGTYNGADGTYRCTATTGSCSVTFNAKGEVIGNSDNWVFVPDKGATSDVPDSDYLNYGFWLKRTADSDGATTYNEVETFASSSVAQTTALTDVAGSASYEGGAVGVYVNDVLNTDGTTASSTSGHFTADAELTATFGQVQVSDTDTDGTIATSMLNTIRGTIDNFELSGGEGNAWSVALSGDIVVADRDFSGTAKGGVGDGSFSGMFHGEATGDSGASLEENTSVYPHTVTGEFNAGFTNGSVAGAFGAREVKE